MEVEEHATAHRAHRERALRRVVAEALVEDVSALAYEALAAAVYKVERATQGAATDSELEGRQLL